MSNTGYIVEFQNNDFIPSENDTTLASGYDCVADLLGSFDNKKSELITLRLSTCRNAYLTANAIFVDLKTMLGRGSTPSLFLSALWHMKKREWDKARRCFGGKNDNKGENIGAFFSEIDKKFSAWDRRNELDALLWQEIETSDRKIGIKGELKAILFGEVRTRSLSPVEHEWDRKYYCLDTDHYVDAEIEVVLQYLREATQTLNAAYSVVNLACSYGSLQTAWVSRNALGLQVSQPTIWGEMFSLVEGEKNLLGMSVEQENPSYLCWQKKDGTIIQFPRSEPCSLDTLTKVFDSLLLKIEETIAQIKDELSKRFHPNISPPPLPRPFKVDLRPEALKVRLDHKHLHLETPCIGSTPTAETVKIGLVGCEIPDEYFCEYWFKDEDCRKIILDTSMMAIKEASSQGVSALVFPEYALPKGSGIEELQSLANERNIILIGGLEGSMIDNTLINKAIVSFPEKIAACFQEKQWHSIYEPKINGDGKIQVFRDTPIGNFTAIICCDFTEIPMIRILSEFAGILHHVFVLTRNPRHELFCQLALADCYRLYTHIAVVNNYPQPQIEGQKKKTQTFVCSPTRDAKSRIMSPASSKTVGAGSLTAEINVYKLSLKELHGALTESSHPDILTVPRCRRLVQQRPMA